MSVPVRRHVRRVHCLPKPLSGIPKTTRDVLREEEEDEQDSSPEIRSKAPEDSEE
jgi:hypothetical protein